PGTVEGTPGETGSPNPYNINGQRSKNNNYYIDGVSTVTGEAHNNQIIPPLDAIQEHCCPKQDRPVALHPENAELIAPRLADSGGGLGFIVLRPVQITRAPE